MSFEEEFDKIIRQKAEDARFPFDESNWEKTGRLIDAERKAARMLNLKKFFLPGVIAFAIGSASLVAYNYFKNNQQQNGYSLLGTPAMDEVKMNEQNLTLNVNETRNTNEQSASSNLQNESTSLQNAAKDALITNSEKETPALDILQSNTVSGTNTQVDAITKTTINPEETNTPKSDIDGSQQTGGESTASEAKEPTITNNNNNQVLAENNSIQDKSTTEEIALPNETAGAPDILEIDQLSAIYSTVPNEISEQELFPTPFFALIRYDDDYYKGRRPKTHFLNAELGGTYLLGWDTKNGKDGQGFNWFGGVNYAVYLTKKISLGIGLQGYNIKNINQAFYNSAKTEYGFGSTNSYTVITSNDLYYASVPLKLSYSLNSSNQVGVGLNAGYLIGAQSTVKTYDLSDKNNTSAETKKGVYEGTQSRNIMLSAFYRTLVCKRFAVNAEFVYGTTDIFKNMGTIKNVEKPMGIRLSLQYTLFDK